MKKIKKGIPFLLSLLLVFGTAGCQKKENSVSIDMSNEEVLTETTLPISKEGVTLTIWAENRSQGYAKSYNDFEAFQILAEKTGVTLDFKHPTGSAKEQLGVMLASGDLPDIIYPGGWRNYKQEVESGVFLTLNEQIEKWAPNFRKVLENPTYADAYNSIYGGKQVAFPMLADDEKFLCFNGYFIRQDWLDKVNLSVPTTIEEWETVLRAFVNNDLNENGEKDEIGFSTLKEMAAGNAVFMPCFDLQCYNYYLSPTTGKITHAILEPGFKDYIKTINRWYSDGLINDNYLNTQGKELDAMVLNNQVGAFHCDNNNSMPKYMQANPDIKLTAVPYPVSSDGKSHTAMGPMVRNWAAMITKNCKHVKEAVQLLDYFYSPETSDLMNWGVEGESYTVSSDGSKKFTDAIMKNPDGKTPYEAICKYMTNTGFVGFNQYKAAAALEDQLSPEIKKVKSDSVTYMSEADKSWGLPDFYTTVEEDKQISAMSADLNTYLEETYSKLIMGVEPLENLDSFIATAKEMGIEKIIEIKQAAYDRK